MKIYPKTAIILISASIIPLTIISLISYILAEKTITREELVHLQAIAHIQKHRVEGMIDRNRERVDLITSRVPMRVAMLEFMKTGDRDQQEIAIAAISGAKEAVKDIKKVYILSLDGRVVASTDRAMHGADHSGMDYFIRGREGYSLDILSSDAKGEVTNYLSAPIYHDGKAIGVMVAEVAFDSIASITKDYTGLGNTGESLLAKRDKDGDALYIVPLRFDPQAALKRKVSRRDTHIAITQALLKNEMASADQVDYRGRPVLAVTSYIKETGWGLVVREDKEEAYLPLARLRYLTAAFVVITLILISALSFYTARSITAPIASLTHAARRIGEGDLSVRVAETSTDEIGDLERYFNKMAEELIASNISLNEAQRIAHVGSWELDLVNNLITWSDEISRIFEIDPKKFGASYKVFLDTIHPEDRAAVDLAYTNSLKTRSPYAIDHRLLFPDGRIKHVHEQCETSYDGDGKPLRSVGTVKDITEHKKAEVDIQRHYDTEAAISTLLWMSLKDTPLDKLMKDTLDLILSIQWLTFESSGSIFLVEDEPGVLIMKASKGLSESLQKSCSRVPFGKCLCGLTGATREIQFADCCDERHEIHYDGMTPHGHYCVPILSGDKVLGVVNTYLKAGHRQDQKEVAFLTTIADTLAGIVIRKRSEDSIHNSEERYRRLVESVTNYIYTVKVENGFPVHTSHGPGCVAVTGYTSDEYEVDPNLWYRMVCEEDRKGVIGQSVNVLSGKDVQPLEHRIIHRDGSIRWVRNTPVPKYSEQGSLIAYDGLVSDITERRKLEEQLRHSQKMEVVGTLAGGIAHDFNNILTAMMGYASLLIMEIKSDEPSSHHAKQILVLAEKAANLTQGLLAFSRKQIINPKSTDIDDVIKRVEKILRRVIGEDIELKTILSEKKLAVMADSGQIEQILMNLCANARDAMPDGGSLTIETDIVELDSEYTKKYGYGEPGHYLLVSVADTGTGIDEKTKEKVFEPFFTTKELGKGTGLGLSMAYGIIKQHNGYINVSSELGKGTRFDIYLPVIKSPMVEEVKYAGQALPVGGAETILIAEDELFLREVTKEVLEEFGYKIIVAVDGADAIDKFMKNRDDIHLLILDAVMPKKSGKQVYEEIRKVRPDIKVAFLSGYAADLLKNKDIAEEGLTLISKPISPDELLKKIREVLDK